MYNYTVKNLSYCCNNENENKLLTGCKSIWRDNMDKIKLLKEMMEVVKKYFLKNKNPYIIMEDYEYFREAITLYAKQHNLIKSVLLLVDNNMYERRSNCTC